MFLKYLMAAATMFAAAAGASQAHADIFTVDVMTGDIGAAFNARTSSESLFTAANNSQHARFVYSGPLQFSSTGTQNTTPAGDLNSTFFGSNVSGISGYSDLTAVPPSPVPDYGSFATATTFLAASGSVAGYGYGSLYLFVDRTDVAAGTKLTITHDDGVSVYDNGVLLGGTTAGPTTSVTETVTVATTGQIAIVYARENGTPSVLTVTTAAVPEPASLAILGGALLGFAGLVRRRG